MTHTAKQPITRKNAHTPIAASALLAAGAAR
jgi:hypothetical protein